jgi:hypothetical protein
MRLTETFSLYQQKNQHFLHLLLIKGLTRVLGVVYGEGLLCHICQAPVETDGFWIGTETTTYKFCGPGCQSAFLDNLSNNGSSNTHLSEISVSRRI